MKYILIPIDFSDHAWNAIVYALKLFHDTPCEFTFLNAYGVDVFQVTKRTSTSRMAVLDQAVKVTSKGQLNSLLEDIRGSKPSIKHSFKTKAVKGTLVSAIKKLLKKKHYDTIIMGTKGATGAAALFLGSNTHQVIKRIDYCPILVIPKEADYKAISNLAFITNFERNYYNAEIRPILELATIDHATLRMLHVYKKQGLDARQQHNSDTLESYLKNIPYQFHVMEDFATLEKAIEAFIEELAIDVLAMVNYKHSFIDRLLREAVIKKLVFHTKIPFLVIPADHE